MTSDLQLSGPTVTLFGGRDALDQALSDEFGRRGCSIHSVSVPTGWLTTATNVVVRLDTEVGEHAVRELAGADVPPAHVVFVCGTTSDLATTDRLSELCRQCGDHHDVCLIWHAPFDDELDDTGEPVRTDPTTAPRDLAAAIADEVGVQESWTSGPSFATHVFEPHRHRGSV